MAGLEVLTKREAEVAIWISRGATNKAIAHEMDISVRTVESHVRSILQTLGFLRRTQIIAWVFENSPKTFLQRVSPSE